jgi:hypothetical protein
MLTIVSAIPFVPEYGSNLLMLIWTSELAASSVAMYDSFCCKIVAEEV